MTPKIKTFKNMYFLTCYDKSIVICYEKNLYRDFFTVIYVIFTVLNDVTTTKNTGISVTH